jgi:exosortase O
MKEFGDSIHVALGLGGFALSCLLLLHTTKKFVSRTGSERIESDLNFSHTALKKPWKFYLLAMLLCLLVIGEGVVLYRHQNTSIQNASPQNNFELQIQDYTLTEIPFTAKEEGFFVNREIEFSKKYQGQTLNGRSFSLLIVASKSWKSHHNPEICLQGLGYSIDSSEILQIGDVQVRQVQVDQGKAKVIYWFVSRDKTIMDYSQRVWEGIFHPEQAWALIEVGFTGQIEAGVVDLKDAITKLNSAIQQQLKQL